MHILIVYLIATVVHIQLVSSTRYSCDTTSACGCSKNDAEVNKIVGGESAVDSSWGWSISFQTKSGQHFCGGAILTPNFIITAAHCIENITATLLTHRIVAAIDKLSESNSNKAQARSIDRVAIHPQYNKDTNANDIAILHVSQPLILTLERNPTRLCLPTVQPSNRTLGYPAPDLSLVAIGWGVLAESGSVPSNLHLQQVTLKSMSSAHSMCRPTIKDKQVQFCAAHIGGGKDTCQGDSGGPIMHFEPKSRRWVLVGITSYGIGCGNALYAGVYTRVSAYNSWLQSIVTEPFYTTPVDQASISEMGSSGSVTSRNFLSIFSSILLVGISSFIVL